MTDDCELPPPARPPLLPTHSNKQKLLVVVNASGRQASSVIRCAAAVGYRVRGQTRSVRKNVALTTELAELPNVTLVEGSLEDEHFVSNELFRDANLAFINTTPYGWTDEVSTGKRLADAAARAGVSFYVYSGLTDHSQHDVPLEPLPLWQTKFEVEEYIRSLGIPAAFPYVGCYHNNFSSRPYPLWQLLPMPDGGFEWRTPFPADIGIPFIDTEHDLGVAIIQILKDGPAKWNGQRYVLGMTTASCMACEGLMT